MENKAQQDDLWICRRRIGGGDDPYESKEAQTLYYIYDPVEPYTARQVEPIEGHARTMSKVEVCPGVEVFMTMEQKIKWKARQVEAQGYLSQPEIKPPEKGNK